MGNVVNDLELKENQFSVDWQQVYFKIEEAIVYFSNKIEIKKESNEDDTFVSEGLSNVCVTTKQDINGNQISTENAMQKNEIEEDLLTIQNEIQTVNPPIDHQSSSSFPKLSESNDRFEFTHPNESQAEESITMLCDKENVEEAYSMESYQCMEDDEPIALEARSRIQGTPNIKVPILESDIYDYESIDIGGLKSLKKVKLLKGHEDAVATLQCDARRIFSGSSDHQVRLWDIRSGKLIRILKGHKGGIRSLCFDKAIVVSASWDTTVIVWDIVKFNQISVLFGHRGAVTCVCMNDSIIVSGSADKTIKTWDRELWCCTTTLKGHRGEITQVMIVDHEQLLSSSQDRTLNLWSLKTHMVLRTFYGHSSAVLDAKVYGQLIDSSSIEGNVLFWDIETGQCEAEIAVNSSQINCLVFHLSRFFTGSSDGVIREWDIETCTCLRSFKGHSSPVLAICVFASKIVSGSYDGMIRIWDLENRVQQIGGRYNAMNENTIEGCTVYESGVIPKINMMSS